MEHKIYNKIRKYKIPLLFRIIIMVFLALLGIFMIILPIPGSAIIGWGLVILGFIFILEVKNIKFITKIRKGLLYFLQNLKDKKIRNHKIKDIKKHIKHILQNKR
ncbi:MAG: hypothetical protein Q9M94_02390 [Candidatus Gracilibacteria bacterium]|nr:hypothetical protein [Candidatus Gracilibacteria bacterium]MDQ7022657.1 hypothetical protein [Candidatus Gracilibacteria bacterium]